MMIIPLLYKDKNFCTTEVRIFSTMESGSGEAGLLTRMLNPTTGGTGIGGVNGFKNPKSKIYEEAIPS